MSRLLLSHVPAAKLEKAQARSAVLAKKRWVRKIQTTQSKNADDAMKPTACSSSSSSTGNGSHGNKTDGRDDRRRAATRNGTAGAAAATAGSSHESQRRHRKCCPSCGLVVLGHPLDTISAWCGEVDGPNGPAMTTAERMSGVIGWKTTGSGNTTNAEGGGGGEAGACDGRGKDYSYVGAAAIALTLGERAVSTVAEQLGVAIKERRRAHDTSMAMLADAKARAIKVRR